MILVFLYGLIFGSFFNVCIYRIPRGESINFPPSHCTNCNNKIKWYDLFPIISYIVLKGKCRYCGEKISLRYPLIELITGILFAALYVKYGYSFSLLQYCILVSLLIVIGMIDYDTTDVYFAISLTGVILGVLFIIANYFFFNHSINISLQYFLGGALGGGIIAVIILLTHGMGWGDAEICLVCGLFLGLKLTIVMMFFSFVFGGIIGIALLLLKKKGRKDYIPFGPFIAIGGVFTTLFGNLIINWYISLL